MSGTGPVPLASSSLLSGFAFAGSPLDRADHLRDDAEALVAHWPRARVIVLDTQGNAFADAAGQLLALDGATLGGGPGAAIFLGLAGEIAWFAADAETVALEAPGRVDLRQAAVDWPAFESDAFAFARAMLYWRTRTRFCGLCGGHVEFRRAGYVGHCMQCSTDHYPRVDPAVIVAVSDGQRLLLGRQAAWPPRRYSVLAGFVEPGETLEQTVVREVFEETGVRVRAYGYLGTQPWPFPGALMLGFEAMAEADEPRVDGELEDARWVTVDDVAAALREDGGDVEGIRLPPRLSIARALIERWYRSMQDG